MYDSPRCASRYPPAEPGAAVCEHSVLKEDIAVISLTVHLTSLAATGYDPLLDTAPELARAMAASVTQHIACGERAGQKVRRIGSGCGDAGARLVLTGPRGARVNGLSWHPNT